MFKEFFFSEWKKWTRDSMMAFLLIYPLLFGALARWALPWLAEQAGFSLLPITPIVLAILAIAAPHIYGSIIGFSILDDRDDQILTSIRVTPLSIAGFLSFRMGMVIVFSFFASLFSLWFADLMPLAAGDMVVIAAAASLLAPMMGLFINAAATNKVEGFVVLKGLMSILLLFPIFGLFFHDAKELFFALAPGFWPAKALFGRISGGRGLFLDPSWYLWIGLIYTGVLTLVSIKVFQKRVVF